MGLGAKQSADCFAGKLVGGVKLDQTTGRWLLVQHAGPCDRAVCLRQNCEAKDPLENALAKRHVIEPAFLLQWQHWNAFG